MRNYAVIGLGSFGCSVARTLISLGYEVLGIDASEKIVKELSHSLTHIISADTRDEEVLKRLDIQDFDGVVVAIGQDVEANILTSMILKQLGVKRIIVKASSGVHGEVLRKIGVDKVVYPEIETGEKVAKNLVGAAFFDYIELSPNFSIVQVLAPRKFVEKTLRNLDLRAKFGIYVMAIKKGEEIVIAPDADTKIEENDLLVVLGEKENVNRISR